jgi:anthranilate synthase component I
MSSEAFADFAVGYSAGRGQAVHRLRVADVETPVAALLKTGFRQPGCFLLESVEGGATLGRYSFIGLNPDLIWRAHDAACEININPALGPEAFSPCAADTLTMLRTLVAQSQIDLPKGAPNTVATFVGFFGYETARLAEKLPAPKTDPIGTPDMLFVRPTVLMIFDRIKDALHLVAPVYPKPTVTAKMAWENANERLDAIEALLDASLPISESKTTFGGNDLHLTPTLSPDRYADMVAQAKKYITAGDIFQVVLAQRFSVAFTLPPFDLYRALRRINPSPFLYFFDFPGFAVVGSSPEILVRVRDGDVTVRPIAGTAPRGVDDAADQANEIALLANPKERAEHLMLLDLGRNDVGRIATPASVDVTASFTIERYSHVMHIVSNVRGKLRPDKDAIDALLAGFPAGTVSGAPKIRAMEIIHELENEKRGIYAGGVGYFGATGNMDSCIVLRTGIVKDGVLHVTAGAGIVADSDAALENAECRAKSGALAAAAREAYAVALAAKRRQ